MEGRKAPKPSRVGNQQRLQTCLNKNGSLRKDTQGEMFRSLNKLGYT